MSIRKLWPVAVVPLFVLGAAVAPASFADPPAEASCAATGPNISHPTGTSTKITFGVQCSGAATVFVALDVQDAAGGSFALVSSTSNLQGSGGSSSEVLLPIFVPRVCLTVGSDTVCTP